MGLKSHPIPAPPPLWGGENPHGAKRGGAGQAGRGKIAIPRSEHHLGWWRLIQRPVVFYEFVRKEEEVENEQEEPGHVPRVAVAARSDLRWG